MIGAIWLAIKAWGIWDRMARAVGSAWSWATRNPYAAAMALLAVLLALCWHVIDVKDRNIDRLTAENAQIIAAQIEAGRNAAEVLHHQEAVYRDKANEADHAYQTGLADARSAADAYIASHRVRDTYIARDAGPPVASATGVSAAVSAGVPTDAIVVSTRDVQACTDAVTYAIAAHNWALSVDPLPRSPAE